MKKEFDNSYVENSTLNAFVRNLVENKYTARNLLGVIKTINPNNFEVQTPEMPATQKSIISNPKTEMLKEAKYGGYNGYITRLSYTNKGLSPSEINSIVKKGPEV